MTRRRILRSVLLLAAMSMFGSVKAFAAIDPKEVVTGFGNGALKMLADPSLSQEQRRQRFRALLDQYFDFPLIARFVLGRYWRSANDVQRQQFADAFEKYVVAVYSARFSDFIGTTFKATGEYPQGNDVMVVRTEVIRPNGAPPAHVDWRLIRANDGFRITEVSIDGVAMSLTHRQEFTEILQSDGGNIDDLIRRIMARTNPTPK